MLHLSNQATTRLREVEARIRSLRDERGRAVKVADAAKGALRDDDDTSFAAAKAAVDSVKAIEHQIEELTEEQIALLGTAGGPGAVAGGTGFADAARRL